MQIFLLAAIIAVAHLLSASVLSLAAEPEQATTTKLLVEADAEVAFSEPITIDVSKSEGLVDVKFRVYPRKKIHLDSGGRSAWFMAKPGTYTIFIVASGKDGKLFEDEKVATVQPLSLEEWQELAPPEAAQSGQRPASVAQRPAPAPSIFPDPHGLRDDVEALYKDVRSNSKGVQRARMAVLYESVAAEVTQRGLSGESVNGLVDDKLKELDAALQDNWRIFKGMVAGRMNKLAEDGKLTGPPDWSEACRVVAATLREMR